MANESQSSSRFNQWLWRHVERQQRRPRWQRMVFTTLLVVLVVTLAYLWVTTWDCAIC